jgi:CheY-like chemotaxis protein
MRTPRPLLSLAPRLRLALRAPSPVDAIEGMRLLLAVDDVCLRWTWCGWLACLGATLRQVDSAAAALEAIGEAAPFDLVVADLGITRPDGLWLAATLRSLGITTPLLLIDRRRRAGLRQCAAGLGDLVVVDPPTRSDELAASARLTLAAR